MKDTLLAQAKTLPVDDQIELAEAIWNGLVDRHEVPPPTRQQQEELDRRLQRHLANPDDVMPLDDVTAAVKTSLQK